MVVVVGSEVVDIVADGELLAGWTIVCAGDTPLLSDVAVGDEVGDDEHAPSPKASIVSAIPHFHFMLAAFEPLRMDICDLATRARLGEAYRQIGTAIDERPLYPAAQAK